METVSWWDSPIRGLSDWMGPLVISAVIVIFLLVWQFHTLACLIQALPRKSRLRQREILTENETEFYARLQTALPEFEIWPQVSMGAILEPVVKETHPEFWELRRQFQSKICDYVIARKGAARGKGVIAVVELDDRSHETKRDKDAVRDAMLASAGIPTVRWESSNKPNGVQIRDRILALA